MQFSIVRHLYKHPPNIAQIHARADAEIIINFGYPYQNIPGLGRFSERPHHYSDMAKSEYVIRARSSSG